MAGSASLQQRPLNNEAVYDLPPRSPYASDRSFDQKIGYRTKSMLCAPLVARGGDVVGVIQLINKKRDPQLLLRTDEDVERGDVGVDQRSEELLVTLASQAGIALENAVLYDESRRKVEETAAWLEGYVRAACEQAPRLQESAGPWLRERLPQLARGTLRVAVRHTDLLAWRD